MKVYTLRVFTEPVKMLKDLEVGDSFRIVKGFGEVMNCRMVQKYPNDNTVIAYVEQYGYEESFDSDDLVMVDQVQVRINTIRGRE
jgi:hypothetical protein